MEGCLDLGPTFLDRIEGLRLPYHVLVWWSKDYQSDLHALVEEVGKEK